MATGIVVRFGEDRGWGFIKPEGGGPDVMLHVRELLLGVDADLLRNGVRVSYEARSGPRGLRAANVQVLDGEDYLPDVLPVAQFRDEVTAIMTTAVNQIEDVARKYGWVD